MKVTNEFAQIVAKFQHSLLVKSNRSISMISSFPFIYDNSQASAKLWLLHNCLKSQDILVAIKAHGRQDIRDLLIYILYSNFHLLNTVALIGDNLTSNED